MDKFLPTYSLCLLVLACALDNAIHGLCWGRADRMGHHAQAFQQEQQQKRDTEQAQTHPAIGWLHKVLFRLTVTFSSS